MMNLLSQEASIFVYEEIVQCICALEKKVPDVFQPKSIYSGTLAHLKLYFSQSLTQVKVPSLLYGTQQITLHFAVSHRLLHSTRLGQFNSCVQSFVVLVTTPVTILSSRGCDNIVSLRLPQNIAA